MGWKNLFRANSANASEKEAFTDEEFGLAIWSTCKDQASDSVDRLRAALEKGGELPPQERRVSFMVRALLEYHILGLFISSSIRSNTNRQKDAAMSFMLHEAEGAGFDRPSLSAMIARRFDIFHGAANIDPQNQFIFLAVALTKDIHTEPFIHQSTHDEVVKVNLRFVMDTVDILSELRNQAKINTAPSSKLSR